MDFYKTELFLRNKYKTRKYISVDEFQNIKDSFQKEIIDNPKEYKASILDKKLGTYGAYIVVNSYGDIIRQSIFNFMDDDEYFSVEKGNVLYTFNCNLITVKSSKCNFYLPICLIAALYFITASIYLFAVGKIYNSLKIINPVYCIAFLVIFIFATIELVVIVFPDYKHITKNKLEEIKSDYYELGKSDSKLDNKFELNREREKLKEDFVFYSKRNNDLTIESFSNKDIEKAIEVLNEINKRPLLDFIENYEDLHFNYEISFYTAVEMLKSLSIINNIDLRDLSILFNANQIINDNKEFNISNYNEQFYRDYALKKKIDVSCLNFDELETKIIEYFSWEHSIPESVAKTIINAEIISIYRK